MKWIAILLMIVNVVVYLWASRHQDIANETVIHAKFDVNKASMLMLSETGDLKQIGHISGSQQSVSALVGLGKRPTKPDRATPQVIASCYQLGPFKKQASWQSAIEWVEQNEIEFRRIISTSRELQAERVYLGPYQSRSSAESTIQRLKSKNLDHFVYSAENGAVRISLGYFTQTELVEKFLAHLKALNIDAKSRPEYRQLGPFNWLVITVGTAKESQVIKHDWAESAVSLSQVEC